VQNSIHDRELLPFCDNACESMAVNGGRVIAATYSR